MGEYLGVLTVEDFDVVDVRPENTTNWWRGWRRFVKEVYLDRCARVVLKKTKRTRKSTDKRICTLMKEYANSTHHQRVQEITDHHKQKPRDCVSTSPSVILQNEVLVNITPRVRETTTGSRVVIVHGYPNETRCHRIYIVIYVPYKVRQGSSTPTSTKIP